LVLLHANLHLYLLDIKH